MRDQSQVRSSPSQGTSTNLDVLRSMAVLMVLFDHLTRLYELGRFDDVGIFGVLVFFVHTSLVLMYSMQRSHLTGGALERLLSTAIFPDLSS